MGLAAKLNAAFFTVIIVMVLTHAGAQIYGERNAALSSAQKILDPAIKQLADETRSIENRNKELADKLAADPDFNKAYAARDRGGVATAIKNFEDRNSMPGFIFVVDDKDNIWYSSDTPAKFGYEPKDANEEFQTLLDKGQWWAGAAAPTVSGTLSIMGVVPLRNGSKVIGLAAVCEPINSQFLTGLKAKIELTKHSDNVDLLLYSVKDGRVSEMTSGLESNDGGFVTALNREGAKVIHIPDTEAGNRLWKPFKFTDRLGHDLSFVLVTTPMPDIKAKIAAIAGQAAISGFIAFILGLFFSAGIAGRFNRSLQFLTQRAKDLAAHRKNIPSLEGQGLSGEFIELAEVIDTAVQSPRSSVKSLQVQMGRHQEELLEKQKQVETANGQVEAVNRQLMVQSKQLSEISQQINHANSQSILLQQKLASVLQISTEGFLILDPYGNILSANPMFLNWAGCSEGEIAGRYCFDLIKKPGEPRDNGRAGAFSLHGNKPGDLIMNFYPEGTVYHFRQDKAVEVLAHLQPVTTDDNNVQGYIMVLRDKSLHSEAARLRADIISMLQDQIRAPLAVAEQKWSPVLNASSQIGNTAVGNALIDLHGAYQNLLGMVDSLLMMHGGIVPVAPVVRDQISIARLIGDCLEQVAGQARAHQIMLDYKTVTGLPTTAVDKDIVRDVIIQLLEKMISVTAPGGRVRVESASKGNEIRISIFSSGPALPQAEIEDMFAGFIQGKHSEDTYGSRLSMYLVRNNIERLGGRLWAESDRGTYIYFILPIQ